MSNIEEDRVLRVAVDRHRFRRRIHESETVIEPILENTHRDRIRNLLCYMCVYEKRIK